MTLTDAADAMGMTRQGLHYKINQGMISAAFIRKVVMGTKREILLISSAYVQEQVAKETGQE